MERSKTRNVGIVLYDGVEILDFAGPYEVLFAASFGEGRPFNVFTVAPSDDLVTCSGNLLVKPHHSIENHPAIDILIVPGGGLAPDEPAGRRLMQWLGERDSTTEIVASVCTGAYILAQSGVLKNQRVTTHWGAIERMRQEFPDLEIVADERVVDTGRIVTAAGVSAGIDMALHLVERLCGHEAASEVARYMEYDWQAGKHTR